MTSTTTLQLAVIDLHTQTPITGPSFHTNTVHLSSIVRTHGLLNKHTQKELNRLKDLNIVILRMIQQGVV